MRTGCLCPLAGYLGKNAFHNLVDNVMEQPIHVQPRHGIHSHKASAAGDLPSEGVPSRLLHHVGLPVEAVEADDEAGKVGAAAVLGNLGEDQPCRWTVDERV